MHKPLTLLLGGCALIALSAPASALATDYCVPAASACPGGLGTAQATLQGAFDLADNTDALDRVYIGPGTYTAPTTAGFDYNLVTGPIEVIGNGSSGAQKTLLTTPAASTRVLRLRGAAGSSLSGVELRVADNAQLNTFQVTARNVDIGNVAVSSSGTQSNAYFGVEMETGTVFHDGTISLSPTYGRTALMEGAGNAMRDATLVGNGGLTLNSGAGNATVTRVAILAAAYPAINNAGSVLSLSDSLLLQSSTGCAMSVLDQGTDGIINADGVTAIGTSGTSYGICASSINAAPRQAVANVTNSILRGFVNDRGAFSSSTGTGTINVTYSDFNPATDIVAGTGTTVLSPAAGTLGATNVNVDPLFTGGGDYSLSAASPVRDIGDPTAADGLDLVSAPRLCGRIDMGAYEFPGGASCTPVFVPIAGGGGAGGGGGGITTGGSGNPDPGPVSDGPSPAPPLSPPARPDTTAPVLSALGLSHRAFRINRGSRVRFRVSEAAAVTVLLQQRTVKGRKVTFRSRARLRTNAGAGVNGVTVRGLIGQVLLKPGRYRARISAVDAAGNTAKPRTVSFRVLAE